MGPWRGICGKEMEQSSQRVGGSRGFVDER